MDGSILPTCTVCSRNAKLLQLEQNHGAQYGNPAFSAPLLVPFSVESVRLLLPLHPRIIGTTPSLKSWQRRMGREGKGRKRPSAHKLAPEQHPNIWVAIKNKSDTKRSKNAQFFLQGCLDDPVRELPKVLAPSLPSLLSENLDRGRFPSSILGSSLGGSLLSYLHTTTTSTAFGVSVGLSLPLLPPCVLKGGTEGGERRHTGN